jgi:hypothetical protein
MSNRRNQCAAVKGHLDYNQVCEEALKVLEDANEK